MPSRRLRDSLPLLSLPVLVALAYFSSLNGGFVADDWAMIVDNAAHLGSLSAVPHYFVSGVWENSNQNVHDISLYRPVSLLWSFLVYSVADEDPFVWRIAGVALHSLNAVLVAFLIGRLFPQASVAQRVVAAALFALHPATADSVALISATSTDVVLAAFFIAAVLFYDRSRQPGGTAHFAAAVVCFTLAALTKEPGVVFPLVVVAYDLCKGTPLRDLPFGRYAVLFGVAAAYLAVRAAVLGGALEGGRGLELTGAGAARFVDYGLMYLRCLAVPWPLPLYAEHPAFRVAAPWEVAVGATAGLAMAWAALKSRQSRFALAWMALTLAPTLALAFRDVGSFSPRFLYVPVVGLAVVLAAGLIALQRRWQRAGFAAAGALAIVFAFGAHAQSFFWKDQLAFSNMAIGYNPNSAYGYANLAHHHLTRGDKEAAIRTYEDALATVTAPAAKVEITQNLTEIYVADHRFEDTLRLHVGIAELEGFEAIGYVGVGNSHWALGRLDEALAAYRSALSFDPDRFDALYGYGRVSEGLQRYGEAAEAYMRLLQVSEHMELDGGETRALRHAHEFLRKTQPHGPPATPGGAIRQRGQETR